MPKQVGKKWTVTEAILAALALLCSIKIAHGAEAEKRPSVGEWVVTRDVANYPACHSVDDLLRYYELWRADDFEYHKAARTFLSEHCTYIDAETAVMIEATSPRGALCVRPRGDPDCLWINSLAVESRATATKDKAVTKAIPDAVNRNFDREHPECKGWRENKNLPEYCY